MSLTVMFEPSGPNQVSLDTEKSFQVTFSRLGVQGVSGDGLGGGLARVVSDATLDGDGANTPLSVAIPFTEAEKIKLDSIEMGAQANVPIDWGDVTNKPDLSKIEFEAVPAGADLDDYVTPGWYSVRTPGILNSPSGFGVFFVISEDHGAVILIHQVFYDTSSTGGQGSLHQLHREFNSNFAGAPWHEVLHALNLGTDGQVLTSRGEVLLPNFQTPPWPTIAEVQDLIAAIDTPDGGLLAVTSDASLSGLGVATDPLAVANPFTDADEAKLDGIEAGAEVNVKPDWAAASGDDAEILNKPDISGGGISAVATDATIDGDGVNTPLAVANPFSDGDKVKLDNIEAGATADQDLSGLVTDRAAWRPKRLTRFDADNVLGGRVTTLENAPRRITTDAG